MVMFNYGEAPHAPPIKRMRLPHIGASNARTTNLLKSTRVMFIDVTLD